MRSCQEYCLHIYVTVQRQTFWPILQIHLQPHARVIQDETLIHRTRQEGQRVQQDPVPLTGDPERE